MSARVCSQHWHPLARRSPRGRGQYASASQAPGRSLSLQQVSQFSSARLTVTRPRLGLPYTRSLNWRAEYTSAHDRPQDHPQDEDVLSNGLDFGSVQGLSSKNGHTQSSSGYVNGHAQEGSYYVPGIGDRVVGVVVSGTHLTLDVDIGAAKLAQLLVQNLVPQDRISIENCKWVLADDAGGGDDGASSGVPAHGHPHVLYDQEVFAYESPAPLAVEIGTVLEIEVIGETLTGITLLSARRAASRVAFDRIIQIKDENEPFEVMITESNASGLIARVEGLRAFLPQSELMKKPDPSKGETHDAYMGRILWVTFALVREAGWSIVISERNAWINRNLQLWSLHGGTVIRLFPYGVLVQVNDTDIRGMIHISNIASARIDQVSDVFEVGEQVKMLVVESPVPNRFSFSTVLLESEPGLMLRDKQRVFTEAEERATELRKTLLDSRQPTGDDDAEKPAPWEIAKPIANWEWLKFIKEETTPVS